MAYVFKKNDLNYMPNATKFYFKKLRTKRTRLEQDQTNCIHQKKIKLGSIYESSIYQALRKRTYGVVGDHIILARKINLHDKIPYRKKKVGIKFRR